VPIGAISRPALLRASASIDRHIAALGTSTAATVVPQLSNAGSGPIWAPAPRTAIV
jgi:hypothetical protein